MTKETMTVRAALTQKKLLDKQIAEMSHESFVEVISKQTKVLNGMIVSDWEEEAKKLFHSLNDKLRRREAIAKAIIKANAMHTVTLPKFNGIKEHSKKETEELPFASAIARKNYLAFLQDTLIVSLMQQVKCATKTQKAKEKELEQTVITRINNEFGGATQVSPKQIKEREEEIRVANEVLYLDPNNLAKNLRHFKEYVSWYLAEIDSILGHATEVTEITVEY